MFWQTLLKEKMAVTSLKKKRALRNNKIEFITGAENAGFWGIN